MTCYIVRWFFALYMYYIYTHRYTKAFRNNILTVDTTILTTIRTIVVLLAAIATNMRDILAYAALILSMSQRDYHIFRISNARTYQPC